MYKTCHLNSDLTSHQLLYINTVRCMEKVTNFFSRLVVFGKWTSLSVNFWCLSADHRDALTGSSYRLMVSGYFTATEIVKMKTKTMSGNVICGKREILGSRKSSLMFQSVYTRLARYDSKVYLKWTQTQQEA